MADPVSWLAIEPGWKVVGVDGEPIGTIESVQGDAERDIFNGLMVSTGLLTKAEYIPAERVGTIVEGTVQLT
jgi:hypothetical protein